MRAEIASAGPGGGRLPEEVAQLNASVRDLLDHAEVVDEGAIADEGAPLGALAADVAALRDELAAGLVVEASDDLGAALDTVHTDLEAIKARLDQPLELAADEPETASGEAVSAVVDQLATLRDFASAEFSALRQIYESRGDVDLTPLTARLDRLHDELGEVQEAASGGAAGPAVDLDAVHEALADIQAGLANLLDRPVPAAEPAEAAEATGDTYATVDPDVVDLLREEIRASGQPAEELIDALNTELKALRRRIRLRAEGEIFTDEQLELIAESVARRLAADDS